MRVVKKMLSLLLALTILTPAGAPAAYAETGTEGASAQAGSEAIAAAETAEGIEPGGTAEDASSAAEGAEAGTADEAGEDASSEKKEQPEMTEDGHINGEKLKLWLENYLAADHWDEPQCSISIAFWYSGSEETWLYNPDEWMYGVNWSKLPVSMSFAEKLANGELSNDTSINGITLEYALQTVLENSSGPSYSSMLVYLGGNTVSNCAELVPQYAGLPEDYYTDDFYQRSYYTARIMHEVTKTLYQSEEGRFPKVLEYMKQSQPWDMFNRDQWIREELHTSQAHVAYWGNGSGDYIHCTGVVYTNSPIVLTIMMKNISDIDIMGGIAHHFCYLAQNMYWRQYEIEKAKEAAEAEALAVQEAVADQAAAEAEITGVPDTASERPTGTADAAAESLESAETESPASEPVTDDTYSSTPRILLLAASALILLLLIVVAAFRRNRMKSAPPRKATRSGREK